MKKMFTTMAIGLMLVGCGSHVESTVTEIPTPPETAPTECVETKSMEYNSYTGELKDVPCDNATVSEKETSPVATEAPADAPVAGKPDIDVGGTVKPAKE